MPGADRDQRVVEISRPALLDDRHFCEELAALCRKLDIDADAARDEVERCLDELAIEPRDRYLNWSARLARFMYSRSYDHQLDVDRDALVRLQALAQERPLVFLWSHKSHLDSFVFMRAIYDGGFRPQPLSFAGINMAFAGFGTLARNSGAIFLRRSFKGADIYKLVFRHYVRYLVSRRAPLSWSIEGTRSRTGKLMPPKPGLMQWVLDALEANGDESALFVPVSITFDQIAEMDDYIAINRGEPKRRESLGWFLGYIFGMQKSAGRIHVRFGQPVGLQDTGEVPGALLQTDGDTKQARTLKLALEVSRRIEHNTLVTPQSLVCLALLASEGSAVSSDKLQQRLARLQEDAGLAALPREPALARSLSSRLQATLQGLVESGLVRHSGYSWSINPDKALGASYYRNTISHYFLYHALGEMALAVQVHKGDTSREAVAATVLRWRALLKFEYVLVARDSSVQLALAHLDRTRPGWESGYAGSALGDRGWIYARGILGSVIAAYSHFLGCRRNSLPEDALAQAFARDELPSSAVSLPLMQNARRLLHHLQQQPGEREQLQRTINTAISAMASLPPGGSPATSGTRSPH